jgi:hypothetical protein
MTTKLLFTLSTFFLSTSILFAQSNAELMKAVAKSNMETFNLPEGFTAENAPKPKLTGTGLSKRLYALTGEKKKDWKELILNSGEYDHLNAEQKAAAIKRPTKFLKVSHLIEIQADSNPSSVQAVKKDGKVIGYIIEAVDYVEAAIIEDGAWINFYTDDELNVVVEDPETA